MQRARASILAAIVLALFSLAAINTADASSKKSRVKPAPTSEPIAVTAERETFGVPDIMREERGTRPRTAPPSLIPPPGRAERPAKRRGSSTLIPPPMPSPNAANSPPSSVLLQHPPPAVYPPPARDSYGDRVINCIHSAPLNTGVGNNPANPQAYIRQCAN
jgi:hypothetical protein